MGYDNHTATTYKHYIKPDTGMTLIFHVRGGDQQKLQMRANEVSGYFAMKYSQSTHTNYEIAQPINSKCHFPRLRLAMYSLSGMLAPSVELPG